MTTIPPFPSSFVKIPADLPPQFLSLACYSFSQPLLAVWFDPPHPRLFDGIIKQHFSITEAFQPLVNHPVLRSFLHSRTAHLGSLHFPARHALLMVRPDKSIYLGKLQEVLSFVESFASPAPAAPADFPTPVIDEKKFFTHAAAAGTLADLQALPDFRLFAPLPDRPEEIRRMTLFLDAFLP